MVFHPKLDVLVLVKQPGHLEVVVSQKQFCKSCWTGALPVTSSNIMTLPTPMTHVYNLYDFVEWVQSETNLSENQIKDFIMGKETTNGSLSNILRLSEVLEEDYELTEVESTIYNLIENKLTFSEPDESVSIYYWWWHKGFDSFILAIHQNSGDYNDREVVVSSILAYGINSFQNRLTGKTSSC